MEGVPSCASIFPAGRTGRFGRALFRSEVHDSREQGQGPATRTLEPHCLHTNSFTSGSASSGFPGGRYSLKTAVPTTCNLAASRGHDQISCK